MDISVIIVNYNTTPFVKKCVDSIIKYTTLVNYEIIIVDNNSPERTIEKLPILYPKTQFYFLKNNKGFGAGCNYGASNAKGKYLLFLNPDIVLTQDYFSIFMEFLETNQEAAVCSGLLVDDKGNLIHTYSKFPGYYWETLEAVGKGSQRYLEKQLDPNDVLLNEPFEVDWLTGASLFLRKDVFQEVNGFDENIFLYHEDVDLQYRIRKKGFKVYCLPHIRIQHFANSSTKGKGGEDVYFFNLHKNRMIYMYKHYNIFKRNLMRIMHIAGVILRYISLPFREKFRDNKNQKINQYRNMLKIYLSGKNKLFNPDFKIHKV